MDETYMNQRLKAIDKEKNLERILRKNELQWRLTNYTKENI